MILPSANIKLTIGLKLKSSQKNIKFILFVSLLLIMPLIMAPVAVGALLIRPHKAPFLAWRPSWSNWC